MASKPSITGSVFSRTAEGFDNRMATQHGEPDLWRWERARPDLILFRMLCAL